MFEHLPYAGWICVAKKTATKGFHHEWFDDADDAQAYALAEDAKGEEVYLAQSSFTTKDNRRQDNVAAVRAFWLDVDCGPGKPYPTQSDGIAAIEKFCGDISLPLPAITNSGNGIYAHWVLTSDITESQWKEAAWLLKNVSTSCGLQSDPMRTCDSASVLRPVGTRNKKDPENPKPVTVAYTAQPLPFTTFYSSLNAASEKLNIVAQPRAQKSSLNQEFAVDIEGPPAKASIVRQKCPQVNYIASNQAEIPEPLWYSMIGLVRHCTDGEKYIHEWSQEHPEYDERATNKKIAQHIERGFGPTTCSNFRSLHPDGCAGCTQSVTSPIQLGKVYEALIPTIIAELPIEMPKGFSLTKQGLLYEGFPSDEDEEQKPVMFYDHELYVTDLAWDESLGYETATVKHYLAHEGWKTFSFRSAFTNDVRSFHMALADNHIKLVGATNKKIMLLYIESSLAKIQRVRKMSQLMCQMGWKDDGRFVLGRNVILPDGGAEPISLAKSVPLSVGAFHTEGELEPWVEATRIFDSEEMLPLAFAFCAGAFGAPLLKFTGHSGAMVSMYGTSGVGKTLVGTWIASTYGEPRRLIMLKDDTKNALIGRLGAYGNLPLYIDEVTNANPEELSELVYRITQGRDKARLNRNATERTVNNQWQTLAVVSSNSSIVDKLSGLKQDASAELNRVFEFVIPPSVSLDRNLATGVYRTTTDNYGHAGVKYIQHLVANRDAHQEALDRTIQRIDDRTEAHNEERYWSAIAGVAIYGATIAKQLGIIRFDTSRLFEWVVSRIKTMRDTKSGVVNTAMDSLGQMLDDFSNNRLVVGASDNCVVTPKGPLYARIEMKKDLLYISRAKIQEWCQKNHASYTAMRTKLLANNALLDSNARKILGARTEWAGSQQPCWLLDMKNPLVGKYKVDTPSGV